MKIEISKKICRVHDEKSVLNVALNNTIEINHSCGGMGICGTCRVLVISPLELLPQRTKVESKMALERGFGDSERLACQMKPVSGLKCLLPRKRGS